MAMASIDNLAPTKSLIDLSNPDKGHFGLEDYELSFIFDGDEAKLFLQDLMLNMQKKEMLLFFLIIWE